MLTLIKIDLKQRIKNPLTWFVILILFIMSMLNIIKTEELRFNRGFIGHDVYSQWRSEAIDWTRFFDEEKKKLYPEAYYSRQIQTKTEENIIIANEENNIKEVNRLMTFYHLLFAKQGAISDDPIMDTVFQKKVIKMWDDVSNGIHYEDINFRGDRMYIEDSNTILLHAKYYYKLYINDLEPFYSDDNTNVKYTYDYFFHIVPKLIVIMTILFVYNSINKEKNMGSLKLILTQSISRWKYYMSKWVSGVIHLTFVVFLPPIVIGTILGLKNGFVSMEYPTMYLKGTMSSFKPIPNYFDIIKTRAPDYNIRFKLRNFSYVAPSSKNYSGWFSEHRKTEVIAFYKYLLMVALLTILFIGFCIALTQLISAMINNEIISFVATSVIFGIGILISSPFKYEKHLNLSPFTMENGSRIVIGTYNVTALVSTLILLGSTILLLVIGCRYFKKKEV